MWRDVSYCCFVLHRLVVLALLGVVCLVAVQAVAQQPKDLQGKVEPWPPPGWSAGKIAELRLVIGNPVAPTAALITAPIGNDGRFILPLPSGFTSSIWVNPEQSLPIVQGCDFIPTVSPAGVKTLAVNLLVYPSGEVKPFGLLVIRDYVRNNTDPSKDISSSTLLVYADRDVSLSGTGRCGDTHKGKVSLDVKFKQGWNFVIISSEMNKESTVQVKVEAAKKGEFQLWPLRQ